MLTTHIGHETTSGLLSFVFYELLKNPEAYLKAQKEVDRIIGDEAITVQHLSKLEYLNAVLRETLRLHPPAPAFTVRAKQDEVIGGKYLVTKDMALVCFLMEIHKDPAVYGEDAEQFRPERMMNEPFGKLPPNSWKVSVPYCSAAHVKPDTDCSPSETALVDVLVDHSHGRKLYWRWPYCYRTLNSVCRTLIMSL